MKRAVLIFLVVFLVYAATLPGIVSYDSMSYLLAVREALRVGPLAVAGGGEADIGASNPQLVLFHPHHLLYNFILYGVARLSRGLGYDGSTFRLMQVVSAVSMAAAVAFFARTLDTMGLDRKAVVLMAIVFAFSFITWRYAGEVEVYPLLCLVLIVAFNGLLAGRGRGFPHHFLLGALTGFAVLLHQSAALFILAGIVLALPGPRGGVKVRGYLSGCALVTAAGYGVVWAIMAARSPGASLPRWLLGYAITGIDATGQLRAAAPGLAVMGIGKAVVNGGILNQARVAPLAMALGALLLASAAASFIASVRLRRAAVLGACAWFLAFGIFYAWWKPENLKFWLVVLMPLYMVIGSGLSVLVDMIRSPGRRRAFWVAVSIPVAGMIFLNLALDVVPRISFRNNTSYAAAEKLAGELPARSVAILHSGMVTQYLIYFFNRDGIYWCYGFFERLDPVQMERMKDRMAGIIEESLSRGEPAFVSREAVAGAGDALLQYGIDAAAYRSFWDGYRDRLVRAGTFPWEREGVVVEETFYQIKAKEEI